MLVLGVDPGTRHLGYGLIEADGPTMRCAAWGTIEGGKNRPLHQRLHVIHQSLAEVMERWKPQHLAIEEPFVAPERGAKSAIAVGQAQAVALILAAAAEIEIHRYSPSQVKSSVANYGAGSKTQIQRTVQILLGMDDSPMSEDASDALAVALCHVQHWRATERLRPR